MKLPVFYSLVCLFLLLTHFAGAQNTNETLHGVSGYDYIVNGELELAFTHAIDFKNGNKTNSTCRIKSPVQLSYNRNDLKSFIAKPLDFVGYVENPVLASCGYPCGGGLIDIAQGGIRAEENWMQADMKIVSLEEGVSTEFEATGEIYPFMEVFFSIPDYRKDINAGLNQLKFRLFFKGTADSKYHPVRNVKVKSNPSASSGAIDVKALQDELDKAYQELLKVDKTQAETLKNGAQLMTEASVPTPFLPISVTCGSFFGIDQEFALQKMNFSDSDKEKRSAFERQFEMDYYKNLPHIDALKLINFLINPSGNYESPFTGSFSSESEWGQETASFQGVLRFRADRIRKDE